MKKLSTSLFLVLISSTAFGAVKVKTWVNPACAKGLCEVKGVKLYVDQIRTERMSGSMMVAEVETTKKEVLKKYAFVQYIRGCMFTTQTTGENAYLVRSHFENPNSTPFVHKTWEIDSGFDRDPIYHSNPLAGFDEIRGFEIPRNSYYENGNSLTTENSYTWSGKLEHLKENKLFTSDSPTAAAIGSSVPMTVVRNSSLEFRICLHEISKVPTTVDDPKTIIPDPIVCMEWSSNFIYNFGKKVFEEKTAIHPFCQ